MKNFLQTMGQATALVILTCTTVQVATADEHDGWKGEGELGYTSATGNTDSTNLNASLGISRQSGAWKHSASLNVIQAEADDEDSADSKTFRARSEYALNEKSYLFGGLRYEDDKFSGFDFQTSVTAGAGRTFVDNDLHRFEASAGLGFRRLRDDVTGEDNDEGIVTGEALYRYTLSSTATITEALLVESGSDNTYVESETALSSKINGNLALKLSYLLKHNSDVPEGTDKNDEIVTVSLVYGF